MSHKPYTIQVSGETKIMQVTYTGEIDYKTKIEALSEVISILQEDSSIKHLLIDVRNSKSLLSTMQEYKFGKELANSIDLKGSWVALLQNPGSKQDRFIATVAVNRGYNIKEFSSYDEAVSWLQRKSGSHHTNIDLT